MSDPLGTVRVDDNGFGLIGVYIKVDINSWRAVYVDYEKGRHIMPHRTLTDAFPAAFPVMFRPTR